MSDLLATEWASKFFKDNKLSIKDTLSFFNDHRFSDGQELIGNIRKNLIENSENLKNEAELNDAYVLNRYLDFLSSYGKIWDRILTQQFSNSWVSLQDALDLLRIIKKFSMINIQFFEDQLLGLERIYPYNVFFSIGAVFEYCECTICGLDIDSQACPHVRGNLYGGKMAVGIAQNIKNFDHVSMVDNPEDKRCVVTYPDDGEHFKILRYAAVLLAERKFNIISFEAPVMSKRKEENPEYKLLGRNDSCFCSSGKKFKNCCISKRYIEKGHIELIAREKTVDDISM